MCSADSTLEPPGLIPLADGPVVSGYSVGHECADSNVLYEMSRKAGFLEGN
jgi:hypothetical protein